MDVLKLKTYRRPASGEDSRINSLTKLVKTKKFVPGNTTLHGNGLIKKGIEFLEYFINDTPLSELLNRFYNRKGSILENWVGVLGTGNPKVDIVKVKQLLGKNVSDKEIRDIYSASWGDDDFQLHLEKYREELADPEILIYCCAECGDYGCGGIAVTIERIENSIVWIIREEDSSLTFAFDKYQYFEEFNRYLKKLW